MSNLERGVAALDEAREKRKNLNLPKIDFEAYFKARQEDIANIKQANDFSDELVDFFYGERAVVGKRLPWQKTHENFRFRPGEVTLYPGINGHGKSQVVGQIIQYLMMQGDRACIASFEMKPYLSLARMTRQTIGAAKPTEQFIVQYMNWLQGKLWLYDQQGTVKPDRIMGVLYWAAENLKINHFVIDSLMKCGMKATDWDAQKEFLDQVTAAARDLDIHVHLIAHSRKGDDEYAPPNKMDVSGTADITNQVDNVLTVWRNKAKEKVIRQNKAKPEDLDKPDCLLICDKQRNGEWEGEIALWFDAPSMRYKASKDEKVWQMNLA